MSYSHLHVGYSYEDWKKGAESWDCGCLTCNTLAREHDGPYSDMLCVGGLRQTRTEVGRISPASPTRRLARVSTEHVGKPNSRITGRNGR